MALLKFFGIVAAGWLLGASGLLSGLGTFWEIVVIVALGIGVGYCLESAEPPRAESPEERRRRLKAVTQDTLDKFDPPLTGDDYRAAFRRLYRAIDAGRKDVRIEVGNRAFDIAIRY
jgi:hypothetical protein